MRKLILVIVLSLIGLMISGTAIAQESSGVLVTIKVCKPPGMGSGKITMGAIYPTALLQSTGNLDIYTSVMNPVDSSVIIGYSGEYTGGAGTCFVNLLMDNNLNISATIKGNSAGFQNCSTKISNGEFLVCLTGNCNCSGF